MGADRMLFCSFLSCIVLLLNAVTGRVTNTGPPAKLELTCSRIGSSAYEYLITWKKPETGGVPITQYEFRFRKVGLMCSSLLLLFNEQSDLMLL